MGTVKDLEIYGNQEPPDEAIEKELEYAIGRAPQASGEAAERLSEIREASPADSGGDIDARWEEVNTSGSEAVFGHNPTPDQSNVEENAHAMGINFEDNEPLDFVRKIEERDENRFELDESSKSTDDSI